MTSVTEDNLSSDLIYEKALKILNNRVNQNIEIKKKNEVERFQN